MAYEYKQVWVFLMHLHIATAHLVFRHIATLTVKEAFRDNWYKMKTTFVLCLAFILVAAQPRK